MHLASRQKIPHPIGQLTKAYIQLWPSVLSILNLQLILQSPATGTEIAKNKYKLPFLVALVASINPELKYSTERQLHRINHNCYKYNNEKLREALVTETSA